MFTMDMYSVSILFIIIFIIIYYKIIGVQKLFGNESFGTILPLDVVLM